MYLVWAEYNPKKPASTALQEGIQAYIDRFHIHPRVVVVNSDNGVQSDVVEIYRLQRVAKTDYQIGTERPKY